MSLSVIPQQEILVPLQVYPLDNQTKLQLEEEKKQEDIIKIVDEPKLHSPIQPQSLSE